MIEPNPPTSAKEKVHSLHVLFLQDAAFPFLLARISQADCDGIGAQAARFANDENEEFCSAVCGGMAVEAAAGDPLLPHAVMRFRGYIAMT